MPKAIPCELWHTVHIEPRYIPFFFFLIQFIKLKLYAILHVYTLLSRVTPERTNAFLYNRTTKFGSRTTN